VSPTITSPQEPIGAGPAQNLADVLHKMKNAGNRADIFYLKTESQIHAHCFGEWIYQRDKIHFYLLFPSFSNINVSSSAAVRYLY